MALIKTIYECFLDANASYSDSSYKFVKEVIPEWFNGVEYSPIIWIIFGSILIGLSGVLPLLVISIDQSDNLVQGESANKLKILLSFAVGGLLGDVFLHSLPEIWAYDAQRNDGVNSGKMILLGLLTFVAAEKCFSVIQGFVNNNEAENNNEVKSHISGWLNLVANTLDNFTHGLSLGGAFLVSLRVGLLTTFAILVHEIPHEVGDFAILLRAGFNRFQAGIFQLVTAFGGLAGAMLAFTLSGAKTSLEARSSWILPFTAGSFLHIALVTVLPDLLKEENPKESIKQLATLILGIVIMAYVSNIVE